jgi:hypothetical protein
MTHQETIQSLSPKKIKYRYAPLASRTSIRLLRLDADPDSGYGCSRAPLLGSLVVVDLDSRWAYEALSYVWGPATFCESICIDGKFLRLTQNLAYALRKIRKSDIARYVWIDAICIDQANNQERGHQLKHMADIYRNATLVLVYLGEADEPWDVKGDRQDQGFYFQSGALNCLHLLVKEDYRSKFLARTKKYLRGLETTFSRRKIPDEIYHLIGMTRLEWFTRVWTTQEIGLASNAMIYFGRSTMSWSDFTEVYNIIGTELSSHELRELGLRPERVGLLRNLFHQSSGSFLDVLASTHSRGASDPRDRVFAILSHPSAQMPFGSGAVVEVNYKWDLPEVYKQTAVGILKQTCNLDILSYVWQKMDDRIAWPSWVPQWHCGRNTNLLAGAFSTHRAAGDWSLDLKSRFGSVEEEVDRCVLWLQGWKIGSVQEMSQPFTKDSLLSNSPVIEKIKHLRLPLKHPTTMIDLYRRFRSSCQRYQDNFLSHIRTHVEC